MTITHITPREQELMARVAELEKAHDGLKRLYDDLIFQVSQKFKDETRHQTAKRYIASWEGRSVQSEPAKSVADIDDAMQKAFPL